MNLSEQKDLLRKLLQKKRASLPAKRREEAACALCNKLQEHIREFSLVLSFAPFGYEIDLSEINTQLAKEKKLVLPKVEGIQLKLYKVESLSDLEKGYANILEPIASKCEAVSLKDIGCVFVPGLGFDKEKMRLGYGKGHYDRLLNRLPSIKIGVGFVEQLVEDKLPIEMHDEKLDELLLF